MALSAWVTNEARRTCPDACGLDQSDTEETNISTVLRITTLATTEAVSLPRCALLPSRAIRAPHEARFAYQEPLPGFGKKAPTARAEVT